MAFSRYCYIINISVKNCVPQEIDETVSNGKVWELCVQLLFSKKQLMGMGNLGLHTNSSQSMLVVININYLLFHRFHPSSARCHLHNYLWDIFCESEMSVMLGEGRRLMPKMPHYVFILADFQYLLMGNVLQFSAERELAGHPVDSKPDL